MSKEDMDKELTQIEKDALGLWVEYFESKCDPVAEDSDSYCVFGCDLKWVHEKEQDTWYYKHSPDCIYTRAEELVNSRQVILSNLLTAADFEKRLNEINAIRDQRVAKGKRILDNAAIEWEREYLRLYQKAVEAGIWEE